METRNIKTSRILSLIIAAVWVFPLIINVQEGDISESLANIALIVSWLCIYVLKKNYKHDN